MPEPSAAPVTALDIDALVTGATPQFSQQLLERLQVLIAPLAVDDPVRVYGETQMHVLERIALGTTRGTRKLGVPGDGDEGWGTIPSHPTGGIAPGHVDGGH